MTNFSGKHYSKGTQRAFEMSVIIGQSLQSLKNHHKSLQKGCVSVGGLCEH